MACNCNLSFIFCLVIDCETDKHLLLLWICNCYLIPLYHDWSTEKLQNSISTKLPFNRKIHNRKKLLKIHMYIRIILEFFEKYKCPGIIAFFLQNSRYVSNEQPCLKTTGLYDDLYFYLACLAFSISYSVIPF